jgi:hypothetical protein
MLELASKDDELRGLHLSPSLRQDRALASLFNKKTGPKSSRGKASDRSPQERSTPTPPSHSPRLRIPVSRVDAPPFSPAGKKKLSPGSRHGSSTGTTSGSSSRRSSTASRRSPTASRRKGSVETRRGSAISYDAILAALPQAPLGHDQSFRPTEDPTRPEASFDNSDRSTPNLHLYGTSFWVGAWLE